MVDEVAVWAMFYGGLVAMQHHPRNAGVDVDLVGLAVVADRMMVEFKKREDTVWAQWLQESQVL